jgi:hypothetical protein
MAAPAVGSTVFVPLADGNYAAAHVTSNISSSSFNAQPTYFVNAIVFHPKPNTAALEPVAAQLTVYVDRPTAQGFAPARAGHVLPTIASAV